MPLHVEIALNGDRLESLTIGRLEDYKGPDEFHRYRIWVDRDPSKFAEFIHLYNEGARRCALRGLTALDEKIGYK